MALSPNGKTIASGSIDGSVRLWDIETGKITTKWKGHRRAVASVCWSPDGKRIVSGSYDGTARVWDFKSRKPVQGLNPIKTGHEEVFAVHYSPNAMKFATSGYKKTAIIIWDAKTGVLLSTIQLDREAWSLTWKTSDFLIFGTGDGSIEVWMFDTTTWWRIALLEGHKQLVKAITLSPNSRLLASASWDKTTRLWDLNTYLQVGPPLEHEDYVECAAFSADGKLLSTGCADENAYVWNIDAILKAAGFKNFLTIPDATIEQNVICAPPNGSSSEEHISRLSHDMSNRSFLEADATGYPDPLGSADQLPSGFFDDAQVNVHVHSSTTPGALLDRFSSLVRRSRHNEVIITQVSSESSSHTLLGRLSLYLRSPPNTDEISEYPRPPMLSRLHLQEFLSHLSSLFSHSRLDTDETTEPQRSQTPSGSRPGALIGRLSSLFHFPPNAGEAIELQYCQGQNTSSHCSPHVADVATMRDREVIFVARRPDTASEMAKRIKNPKPWVRIVLFLCCVSPGTDDSPVIHETS
jgi:WD40 repeat protein